MHAAADVPKRFLHTCLGEECAESGVLHGGIFALFGQITIGLDEGLDLY